MITQILVAIEYDDTYHSVFNQAVELAQAIHAKLNLLNVLAPSLDSSLNFSPYSDRDWQAYAKRYRQVETAGLRWLEDLANQAQQLGISAEFTQRVGDPGPAICQLAKTCGTDLVVVGSHGRKGLNEMLLGSVSNYVVHHAVCSVMVVHEPRQSHAVG